MQCFNVNSPIYSCASPDVENTYMSSLGVSSTDPVVNVTQTPAFDKDVAFYMFDVQSDKTGSTAVYLDVESTKFNDLATWTIGAVSGYHIIMPLSSHVLVWVCSTPSTRALRTSRGSRRWTRP